MADLIHSLKDSVCLYNCRIKEYPDGTQIFLACDKNIFNPDKLEKKDKDYTLDIECIQSNLKANNERSPRRAKQKIKDYILCNDFTHFITFTLDEKYINREDYSVIIKPLSKWLDNRVQRKGLKYLFVPEFHKDNKSIHFHGVVNDVLCLVDSGTVSVKGLKKPIKMSTYKRKYKGIDFQTVYNVDDWALGFSTAINLYGDRKAVSNYVAKYLEKDFCKVGGRYYLHSNNLAEPKLSYMYVDFGSFPGEPFNFNNLQTYWKYYCNTPKIDNNI